MSQPQLDEKEQQNFNVCHELLKDQLPQFYYGVLIMIVQSLTSGNGLYLQERLSGLCKEMNALNKGEGVA